MLKAFHDCIRASPVFDELELFWYNNEVLAVKRHESVLLFGLNPNTSLPKFEKNNYILLDEGLIANKMPQLLGRLQALMGLNQTIFARQTQIVAVIKTEANAFLSQHHLLGITNASIFLGLTYKEKLIGVAAFAKPVLMKFEKPQYYSYAWERLAFQTGITVVGGASKLFHHFKLNYQPAHVMTYVDANWPQENIFAKLGFVSKDLVSRKKQSIKWIWNY